MRIEVKAELVETSKGIYLKVGNKHFGLTGEMNELVEYLKVISDEKLIKHYENVDGKTCLMFIKFEMKKRGLMIEKK